MYDEEGNLLLTEQYKGNKSMSVSADKWVYRTFYFETALDYKRTFAKKHNVSGLVLFNLRNYLDANDGNLFSVLPSLTLVILALKTLKKASSLASSPPSLSDGFPQTKAGGNRCQT